jgi:hypothetical protein
MMRFIPNWSYDKRPHSCAFVSTFSFDAVKFEVYTTFVSVFIIQLEN